MCEVSKSPGNDNWPDVMSTGAILEGSVFNLPEGTVLKYDPDIKKYVSIEENEDLGPGNECYYSGSAIALDPFVVKDLGDIFRVIPEKLDYREQSEELPDDNAEESPNDNFVRRIKNLEGRISDLEKDVKRIEDSPQIDCINLLDRVIALEMKFDDGSKKVKQYCND